MKFNIAPVRIIRLLLNMVISVLSILLFNFVHSFQCFQSKSLCKQSAIVEVMGVEPINNLCIQIVCQVAGRINISRTVNFAQLYNILFCYT